MYCFESTIRDADGNGRPDRDDANVVDHLYRMATTPGPCVMSMPLL